MKAASELTGAQKENDSLKCPLNEHRHYLAPPSLIKWLTQGKCASNIAQLKPQRLVCRV